MSEHAYEVEVVALRGQTFSLDRGEGEVVLGGGRPAVLRSPAPLDPARAGAVLQQRRARAAP